MRLGRFTEANEAFTLLLDATAPYLHGKHNSTDRHTAGHAIVTLLETGAVLESAGDVIGITLPLLSLVLLNSQAIGLCYLLRCSTVY